MEHVERNDDETVNMEQIINSNSVSQHFDESNCDELERIEGIVDNKFKQEQSFTNEPGSPGVKTENSTAFCNTLENKPEEIENSEFVLFENPADTGILIIQTETDKIEDADNSVQNQVDENNENSLQPQNGQLSPVNVSDVPHETNSKSDNGDISEQINTSATIDETRQIVSIRSKSSTSVASENIIKPEQTDTGNTNSPETLSVMTLESTTRRRMISNNHNFAGDLDTTIDLESNNRDDDNSESKEIRVPHFERRKIFNVLKHIISIVLIVMDLIFDWVEYSEMSSRGNYSIVAERRIKNIEFTVECEGTGKSIQFLYLIFTIVATIMTVIQILNIVYQIFHEIKGTKQSKRLIHETVETFLFLFFIEISQILLVMGFFDVCTFDCVIDKTEILIVVNCVFSFLKLTWRFFTRWKCCTYKWVDPTQKVRRAVTQRRTTSVTRTRHRESTHRDTSNQLTKCDCFSSCCNGNIKYVLLILYFPIVVPVLNLIICLPCIFIYLLYTNIYNKDANRASRRSTWKCAKSCKCCILRCFPSRFEDPDTKALDCTCKKCLSCEQICECCTFRCFPNYLDEPEEDVWECSCGRCMNCEQVCGCCILRCFPSHLEEPKSDIYTCRCAECLACECPFKCFTFRCCPEYLIPPKSDVCTCRCGDCMKCELPCKCFTFRCFPKHLSPPHNDIWTCQCAECLSCELPCKCFTTRCFPDYLTPSKSNWFDCTCGDCMKCERTCCCCILRCFPSLLHEDENCTCIFRECTACEKNLGCFIYRCFPATLNPPKPDIFECTCGKCLSCEQDCVCCKLRCFPSYLEPQKIDWCVCTCCKGPQNRRVLPVFLPIQSMRPLPNLPPPTAPPVTIQPMPLPIYSIPVPRHPTPTPLRPKKPICKDCCKKCNYCFLIILVIIIIILFFLFCYLEAVQIRFVLVCFPNDTFMNATQQVFVQPYLQLFKL